jgi:hypothetical protein
MPTLSCTRCDWPKPGNLLPEWIGGLSAAVSHICQNQADMGHPGSITFGQVEMVRNAG